MKLTTGIAAGCVAAFTAGFVHAAEGLCRPGEGIVFSCSVGAKKVSVCERNGHLAYRFGTQNRLELVYPTTSEERRIGFAWSEAALIGGGITTLDFARDGYQYRVYSKISRGPDRGGPGGDERDFEDGVEVSLQGRLLATFVCDDGGEGFRLPLDRFVPRRQDPSPDK